MAVTIHVNGKSNSLAHKGGMGFTKSTLPDVCKTPSPAGPVPIPYPIIVSMSNSLKNGSKKVKVDGGNSAAIKGSEFSRCSGDEPGTAGGVKSSTNMKEATWILYSFDVKIEGKNACRLTDKMMMNHGNTACLSGHITKLVDLSLADSVLWDECEDQYRTYDTLKKKYSARGTSEYKNLRSVCKNGKGTIEQRLRFRELLEPRIKVAQYLAKERKIYIDMGCDKFDWYKQGKTESERKEIHLGEWKRLNETINKMYKALRAKI